MAKEKYISVTEARICAESLLLDPFLRLAVNAVLDKTPEAESPTAIQEPCEWCVPYEERCGTCRQYFSNDPCSALANHASCVAYGPIDYCPKCGRKLVNENEKSNDS